MARIQIVLSEETAAAVQARGNSSEAGRVCLERYFALLERGLAEARNTLTVAEVSLLCDICNGKIFGPHTLLYLSVEAEDAEDGYFDKWSVDRAALVGKLQRMSAVAIAATVDAIERFWRAASTGMTVPFTTVLGADPEPPVRPA